MPPKLVILGSTITALGVARHAHACGMSPVVIDTVDGLALHSRRARAKFLRGTTLDNVDPTNVLSEGGSDSYIIATGDPWVRFVARHRSLLEAAFSAVLHPSNEVLECCLDKAKFHEKCSAAGIPTPEAWLPGVALRPKTLVPPVLIRPAQSLHFRNAGALPKAVEATSEAEIDDWLARYAERGVQTIVSRSLLGRPLIQWSVGFARRDSEISMLVARKLRPHPSQCAVGTLVETSPNEAIETLGRIVAESLDYFGIGEIEILEDTSDGALNVIEVNARPWLQYALVPAAGLDFINLVTGKPVRERRHGARRCWVDLQSDLFGALSSSTGTVRNGHESPWRYFTQLARANVFARFSFDDPRPALHRQRNGTNRT